MIFCNQNEGAKLGTTLVIFNAKIWTGKSDDSWAEAIAIKGDKIQAIGNNEMIKRFENKEAVIIDAKGKFVSPGFTDSHLHFLEGGMRLASVQLRNVQTKADFIKTIGDFAKTIKPGTWILGGDWDHKNWDGELPQKSWIDSVTQENPVWINRLDGHMSLANSLTLKIANINNDINDIAGGTFVRDADNLLTGILKDNAMSKIELVVPELEDDMKIRALESAMNYVLSNGVTSVHHMGSWDDVRIFEKAKNEKLLKVRISAAVPINTYEKLKQRKESQGWGDEWVKLGGLKGFMDGSLGSHTALMMEAYSDSQEDFGLLVTPENEMYEMAKAGDAFGAQVVIHAIGDKANNIVLNIYEKISKENGDRDRRFRIEHAQHLLPDDIARFSKSGIIASMQPYHCIDDGRWAEPLLGLERMKTTHAYKSLLKNNTLLVFGSDWFVAPPTPLEGIYGAVTRATLDDKNPNGWIPEQKISVIDALKAYTRNPAFASFEENIKGTLEVGKLADLVILDRNIFDIPAEEIWDTKVEYTIVGGKIMYQK